MTTEISTNTTPARGLALQTMGEAMAFAQMVSKSDFAPKDFRGKPESCLLAIQHGAEVGLSPMQSLQSIAVINGRPTIWGDAALALVQSSPACEYVREYIDGEGDKAVAVCEVKRRGYPAPTEAHFSMADAKRAGLAGKSGPWTQYPSRMLALRARGFALRNAFADVLRGLVTAEEAQDYPTQPEPVVVRPKFDEPSGAARGGYRAKPDGNGGVVAERADVVSEPPAQQAKATTGDMYKARSYVQTATKTQLERMQAVIEQRLKSGFYTPNQADELFNLINGKLDILTSEPEDNGQEFEHEAASTEAVS